MKINNKRPILKKTKKTKYHIELVSFNAYFPFKVIIHQWYVQFKAFLAIPTYFKTIG